MSIHEVAVFSAAALAGLGALWFWVAMIVHCVRHTTPRSERRYIWLVIVILGKLPGAFAYYLFVKRGVPAP